MTTPTRRPGLYEERIPPGESADNQAIADLSVAMLRRDARPVPRGQHPKQHGLVRGEFTVEDGLPAEARLGVFREPKSFDCWIRFSNGSQDDDSNGDIHGMAIKLTGVGGRKVLKGEADEDTHDFLLIDTEAMIARDSKSNRALAEIMQRSGRPSLLKSLFFWQSDKQKRSTYVVLRHYVFGLRFHELGCLRKAISHKPASPLTTAYWSTTPYRLGEAAVKYVVKPRLPPPVPEPTDFTSKDRLRAAMVAHLSRAEAVFDFHVQFQTDPASMPIEDASAVWYEADAPPVKVATLTIPPQVFDTPEHREFGENLSYTPWHCLPEHLPLGGINRARKATYEAVSIARHTLNHAPRREPGPGDGPAPSTVPTA